MTKFFFLSALAIFCVGCGSDQSTVVDDSGMTTEQQAEQEAYVNEMDGPAPD
ncbi:hypothetical protein [Allorhodopirellula solitaria]|uniref:Uncharacterized protein n=1 Tax=Allorhodopirellula solitaria TaxID=2527987 RepID=A0A5C5XQK0_9BACT|nr:hypothetical protein [Allorhodopirellula solitaria]TWT64751.1 hypothetical protein CA85_35360 [Allorhodopirellula solitaria]